MILRHVGNRALVMIIHLEKICLAHVSLAQNMLLTRTRVKLETGAMEVTNT